MAPIRKVARKTKKNAVRMRKCIYCGESFPIEIMRRVLSSNSSSIPEWIDRLGPDFEKKIQNSERSMICRKHMESDVKGAKCLPKRLWNRDMEEEEPVENNENSGAMDVEEINGGELRAAEEKENEDGVEEVEEEWDVVEIGAPRTERAINIKIEPIMLGGLKEEAEESNEEIEVFAPEEELINTNVMDIEDEVHRQIVHPEPDGIQCRVCGNKSNIETMTELATEFDAMKNYVKIFGEEVYKNCMANKEPHYFCISDLRKLTDGLMKAKPL